MKRSTAMYTFIGCLIFLIPLVWLGTEEVLLPFNELNTRVRLISYLTYVAILASILLFIFVTFCSIFILITTKRPHPKVAWVVYSIFIFSLLGIFPRYHLGTRVDDAGYVKCVKESRTSTKSSWRVYAKSIDLCKESSGIAGG